MKARQRTSAKRYRVAFGNLQACVFGIVIFALMAASFGFGYHQGAGERSAPGEIAVAKVEPPLEILNKEKDDAARKNVVATPKETPKTKQTKEAGGPSDVIKPKFYQDLLKENQVGAKPIEPIKLPVVKKQTPPKPAPQPEAAVAEKPPEKKETTIRAALEPEKPVQTQPLASKPWSKEGGYTIQVVSLKQFDEALRVVRKLRNAGFQPYIKNADLGPKGRWYRVRVGHYRDKAEAQNALSEIQVRLKLSGAKILSM